MENKTAYEGVIAEVWKPGKVLKIILKVSDDEIEKLSLSLNKPVSVTINQEASD